jgi:hypothetical protein
MTQTEQISERGASTRRWPELDRGIATLPEVDERGASARRWPELDRGIATLPEVDEHAARRALRAQIARLEHELSEIVANGFPHLSPPPVAGQAGAGPCLPTLAALERARDELVARVQQLRHLARARAEHERRARELLAQMKLEPGRYKFARLPVRDLGEGGCGVWEVRPRLGLLGMLAGWWQVKLSSGCPLPPDASPSGLRFCCL